MMHQELFLKLALPYEEIVGTPRGLGDREAYAKANKDVPPVLRGEFIAAMTIADLTDRICREEVDDDSCSGAVTLGKRWLLGVDLDRSRLDSYYSGMANSGAPAAIATIGMRVCYEKNSPRATNQLLAFHLTCPTPGRVFDRVKANAWRSMRLLENRGIPRLQELEDLEEMLFGPGVYGLLEERFRAWQGELEISE